MTNANMQQTIHLEVVQNRRENILNIITTSFVNKVL